MRNQILAIVTALVASSPALAQGNFATEFECQGYQADFTFARDHSSAVTMIHKPEENRAQAIIIDDYTINQTDLHLLLDEQWVNLVDVPIHIVLDLVNYSIEQHTAEAELTLEEGEWSCLELAAAGRMAYALLVLYSLPLPE